MDYEPYDDDGFVCIGSSVDIPDEEEPRKKPVYIQDQVVTDEQGRRRFHGAFTGGFSAGYFNSVGSKEGKSAPPCSVCVACALCAPSAKPPLAAVSYDSVPTGESTAP